MTEVNVFGRLSWLKIFEPDDPYDTGKEKFFATILIPKNDKKNLQIINDGIKRAKEEGIKDKKKFNGETPKKLRVPIHDGDGVKENGEEYGEECKGMWVINTSCQAENPPEVIAGRDGHPARQSEVYSGCYGLVNLNLAPYNYNGNKGIGAYLNSVWKTKDGEPLAGKKKSAAEAFKNVNVDDLDFGDEEDDNLDDIFDGLV